MINPIVGFAGIAVFGTYVFGLSGHNDWWWWVLFLVLVPIIFIDLWWRHNRNWRFLNPVEQNLQRTSHSAAMIVFVILALAVNVWLDGWREFGALFPWMIAHPGDAWLPVALGCALVAVGVARFLAGAHRVAGVRDGLLQSRAFVKLALGGGVTGYLVAMWPWGQLGASLPGFLAVAAVFLVGVWLLATGAVRFLLLTFGGRRQPKMPPAVSDPHGAARDATPAEARAAMRGHGGQRSALDDERF